MKSEKMTSSSESSTLNDEKISSSTNTDDNAFSVLVVDDDLIVRTIHRTMLTAQGMKVHLAVDGQEAVDIHRAGATFDLILMDLEMPILDGSQATRELRDMGINCTIIGVTSGNEAERKAFMEAGLDDCIIKPLTLSKISSYIPMITNYNDDEEEVVEENSGSCSYAEEEDDDHNSSCSSSKFP